MDAIPVQNDVQESVNNFLNYIKRFRPDIPLDTFPAQNDTPSPVRVNGFYKVTGTKEATFYATTLPPNQTITTGWSAMGMTGMLGQLQILYAYYTPGVENSEGYTWKFTFQSDTNQTIDGYQNATAVTLYPPGVIPYVSRRLSGSLYGYYVVKESIPAFFFTGPTPFGFTEGWVVTGLPTLPGTYQVSDYRENIFNGLDKNGISTYVNVAYLQGLDGVVPVNNATPVYVNGPPVVTREADFISAFIPGNFNTGVNVVVPVVELNSNVQTGTYMNFRNLNENTEPSSDISGRLEEVKNMGFSSAAILALFATGPQDEKLFTKDPDNSNFNPKFKQHTNHVMYQRVIPFPSPNPTYQGQVITLELLPTQLGDLFSNMYLKVTLPTIPAPYVTAANIGRHLIKQVEFMINETTVETLYDDWYVIRDQLFLDADEQNGTTTLMTGVANEVFIPLEFFFCRRYSRTTGRQRLRKPYFPICAMRNQKIYLRFTFQPNTWWSNVAVPNTFDIYPVGTNLYPKLITEEILLDTKERLYYKNTPLRYIVNSVKKESSLQFNISNPQVNLTASFPVQTLAWFFRNKNYERTGDGVYYDSRYNYGYTTQYIQATTPLQFQTGTVNFIDVITSAQLTLNNIDITSTYPGGLYYSFKQPMEHAISIPAKNIYTYSFGLTPKEYNQGGYLNFSKLNSQTTTLTLNFNTNYTSQLTQGYILYVFYYGYSFLEFQGGFARSPFV